MITRLVLLTALVLAATTQAQNIDFATINLQTVKLTDNLHVLMGGPAQGNIIVFSGPDGVLLIDSMYAPMHQKIVDAVAAISRQPIRYLVNTHLHGDHTAGNEALAKFGAIVISHENMRQRMTGAGLPVLTYSDSMTLHFNGEEIYIYHPEPSHTDGDSIIYFRNANVMHVGDMPASLRYPNIGVNEGGSVDGMIAAARQIMRVANADTKIVPGHLGPVVGFKEIEQQLEMFYAVRELVLADIRDGKPLQVVVASKPTAAFDAERLGGAITPDRFVTLVYTDLARRTR